MIMGKMLEHEKFIMGKVITREKFYAKVITRKFNHE